MQVKPDLNGWLVEPNSVPELAEAMQRILDSPPLTGPSCHFSSTFPQHAEQLCELYHHIIQDETKKSAAYQLLDKEMDCGGHMHLKCTECGEFHHLGCDFMSSVGEHVLSHHKFRIDNSKTLIYGLCGDCCEKEKDKCLL